MKKLIALGALAMVALGGAGCQSSNPYNVSFDSIRDNPTPEMMTLSERPVDVDRHVGYTDNVNVRLMWEDIGRTWYADHPSRLSPSDIIYISGKPR